jgi:hypothetical protein
MLDVGASRTAVRLPSLLPPGGEASNPASILENISTQLQVQLVVRVVLAVSHFACRLSAPPIEIEKLMCDAACYNQ